ncbi:UDP-N-acetylmuramate:L-alanyl-gamma-D-glutamyl-meso-diaminopimelate ligase [Denitromonas sp.]|uniref:UDP-N-acetylmuramate:L-alanyl-gamma-D-glutamyl- meso-diaminopimelate ligase n=1 Tax=Denitromonas sp. TaxID=2734609 RepID=UPI003A8B099D
MHIHILGICGTFMGGVALLARSAGHTVTGCDANVYPPMSTQLEAEGIALTAGYDAAQMALAPDVYVVGNAISRGNPLLEAILDAGAPYVSGPQWLADHVLRDKWVLGVAGTHGKTKTASLLAWMLEDGGLNPGFLIGGVPKNFGVSARLTDSPFFVIEADEYDTAFCDKRSKFVHYRPRTVILNNLEFDHADIFADLAAIETQFHHLVRIMPTSGRIIANAEADALARVIDRGCWSEIEWFNRPDGWQATLDETGVAQFALAGQALGSVATPMAGTHNLSNALAAVAAARHVGVPPAAAIAALGRFDGVRRRLEVRGVANGVTVYDDFAHHPTAIALTIAGLRKHIQQGRILAILEPRSNTMKLGVMKAQLPESLAGADAVLCYHGGVDWDVPGALSPLGGAVRCFDDVSDLVAAAVAAAEPGDHVLVMSNGGFGGIHDKLLAALA